MSLSDLLNGAQNVIVMMGLQNVPLAYVAIGLAITVLGYFIFGRSRGG